MKKSSTRYEGSAAIMGGAMYVLAFVVVFLCYFSF